MTAAALRVVVLLACTAATSVAQQPPTTETLDEVTVAAPQERDRGRGPAISIRNTNVVTVSLEKTLGVRLLATKAEPQVVFRSKSAARQLPEADSELAKVYQRTRLDLLPDRLLALKPPWILEAGYVLAANIDEADGVPAHIPFGPGLALVNLNHVSLRDSHPRTRIDLKNAMHPQTRKCQSTFSIGDMWPQGTNPYVLLADSLRNCDRAIKRREGDLLFAENIPAEFRQAVQELHDPIASRMANLLGSEPGNMFVAWWLDSPHDGYRFQLSWNRNSLLLFNGSGWKQGISATQREALRLSFMREQIQRRIRESDWPGAFTQSAVDYLLLLTRSGEDHTTRQRLSRELPAWIAGCARSQGRRGIGNPEEDVSSLECGLVLQFAYDAVARSRSSGKENIYDNWRRLLGASFRRGQSGAKPADFLASSADARLVARGLVDGSVDWPKFAAALDGAGVKLKTISGGTLPAFEVQSLKYFED